MKQKTVSLAASLFFFLVSCAVITVNIYFPEKDVQEAYKTLEKELMKPGGESAPPESKPQSLLPFTFSSIAYAQEGSELADRIAETVKKMPEVVEAYRQMGERSSQMDGLRDSGAVGEGNKGLLVAREGTLSPADRTSIDQENANRRTVMRGMARAIVRINRKPENDSTVNQVQPQAEEQFAAIRRDSAKKGWWIQDPNGNWVRK